MSLRVNLYSDTQSRPTAAMRRAIAEAEVGDEQRLDDPTVLRLQERVAELLGHEAGLFLPSGTMCNGIGFRLHIRPGGDEVILHRTSHPIIAEAGGPAELAGAMTNRLDGEAGMFTGRAGGGGHPPRRPLPAALPPGVGGADHEHGRRAGVAARADPRRAGGGPRVTACAPISTAPAC